MNYSLWFVIRKVGIYFIISFAYFSQLTRLMEFYGAETVGDYYFTPPSIGFFIFTFLYFGRAKKQLIKRL